MCFSRVLRRALYPLGNRSVRNPKVTVIWKSFNESQTVRYMKPPNCRKRQGRRAGRRSSLDAKRPTRTISARILS